MRSGQSSGLFPLAPPLTREQNLLTASGTLVDEDEADYMLPTMSTLAISLEGSSWRDEGLSQKQDLSIGRKMQTPEHRSRSTTGRTPASGRSGSTVRSHSRHGLGKFQPTAQRYHPRKCTEKPESPCALFDVYTAGIRELSDALFQGLITSVLILDTYLAQIDRHNDTLRAITHLAPRGKLLRLARQRDLERKLGQCRGPLHGIPLVVK